MITVYVFSQQVRNKAARTKASKEALQGRGPLVEFNYPSSKSPSGHFTHRNVRLIGANRNYLIGLEILPSENGGKPKHQFKRFRRDKVIYFNLKEFNPQSL